MLTPNDRELLAAMKITCDDLPEAPRTVTIDWFIDHEQGVIFSPDVERALWLIRRAESAINEHDRIVSGLQGRMGNLILQRDQAHRDGLWWPLLAVVAGVVGWAVGRWG